MKRHRHLAPAAALLLAAALAGCTAAPTLDPTIPPPAVVPVTIEPTIPSPPTAVPTATSTTYPLGGVSWVLNWLNGEHLLEGTYITLDFGDDTIGGFAGCNGYRGGGPDNPYVLNQEGDLALPEVTITTLVCDNPPGVMAQEAAYIEALSSVTGYRDHGFSLELTNAAGDIVLNYSRRAEYAQDPAALHGTAWRLVAMYSRLPRGGEAWTLTFHDDGRTASGLAGCRPYVAGYHADSDRLKFTTTAVAGPACGSQALRDLEDTYLTMLGWVDRFDRSVPGAPLELHLHTARGETLRYEPLQAEMQPPLPGTEWELFAFAGPTMSGDFPVHTDPLSGTHITVTFEEGQVGGSAGCNRYGGSYELDGTHLSVVELGSTKKACLEPEGIMEQEARYLGWLGEATAARVRGTQIWLDAGEGRTLLFRPSVPIARHVPLPSAAEALAQYVPWDPGKDPTEIVIAAIEGWLKAGGDPAHLPDQLSPALITVQEAELTGGEAPEVVVTIPLKPLPLLVFVQSPDRAGWTGYPLPPDYYTRVILKVLPDGTSLRMEYEDMPLVRLEDLTGDGVADVSLIYRLAGWRPTGVWEGAYTWRDGAFHPIAPTEDSTEDPRPDVPFADLMAAPSRYHGTELCTSGVYSTGFEASALGASTVTRDGTLYLSEPTIWIEDASAVEVRGECITTGTVPEYEFCEARVCGTFETGGPFGHLGGYEHQIRQ